MSFPRTTGWEPAGLDQENFTGVVVDTIRSRICEKCEEWSMVTHGDPAYLVGENGGNEKCYETIDIYLDRKCHYHP